MKEIRTEISLEAPVDRVWELVSDVTLYQHWNPLFRLVSGRMHLDEQLELMVNLPQMDPFTIRPMLLSIVPATKIYWQYIWLNKALLTWDYCTVLEEIDSNQLKYVQKSRFGGLLGPLFSLGMSKSIAEGMENLNKALKRWGEKGNIQCLRC